MEINKLRKKGLSWKLNKIFNSNESVVNFIKENPKVKKNIC